MDEQECKTIDSATAALLDAEDQRRLQRIRDILDEVDEKLNRFESVRRNREAKAQRHEED